MVKTLAIGMLCAASAAAYAQTRVPVRGTIESLQGNVLTVKAMDRRDMKIELAPNATVAYVKAVKLTDLKPGTPLGTTAVERGDGKLVAREVHVFTAGLSNEGHRPREDDPKISMTNTTVSATMQAANGRELTLSYKGGTKTVIVPDDTPVVMPVEADRSYLKPGEYVKVNASMNNDGKLSASRVEVSKDGVRPQ